MYNLRVAHRTLVVKSVKTVTFPCMPQESRVCGECPKGNTCSQTPFIWIPYWERVKRVSTVNNKLFKSYIKRKFNNFLLKKHL